MRKRIVSKTNTSKTNTEQLIRTVAKKGEDLANQLLSDDSDLIPKSEELKKKPLKAAELQFVHIITTQKCSLGDAAVQCGFSSRMGSHLMKEPRILEEIERRRQALFQSTLISKEWVTNELLTLIADSKANNSFKDKTIILKSLEMIAKMNGFNQFNNVQVQNKVGSIKINIIKNETKEQEGYGLFDLDEQIKDAIKKID